MHTRFCRMQAKEPHMTEESQMVTLTVMMGAFLMRMIYHAVREVQWAFVFVIYSACLDYRLGPISTTDLDVLIFRQGSILVYSNLQAFLRTSKRVLLL